jgi:hypothetical protein
MIDDESLYPVSTYIFSTPVQLIGNTKYVVEILPGSTVSVYLRIPSNYSGGSAYDINGSRTFTRTIPMILYDAYPMPTNVNAVVTGSSSVNITFIGPVNINGSFPDIESYTAIGGGVSTSILASNLSSNSGVLTNSGYLYKWQYGYLKPLKYYYL